MAEQCDIGLIGLAVMGQNLILNMADHGFTVAAYNRTTSKVDDFLTGPAKGKSIVGCHSLEEFVKSLKKPRRVMLMVKAGKPVGQTIEQLAPLLDPNDIIIDGGNSYYLDTEQQIKDLEQKSILYMAKRPGPMSNPFSRPLPPRSALTTTSPVVNGSVPAAPAITSRWCITASSTATCSSSARRTAF
jgi:hypothetical protein